MHQWIVLRTIVNRTAVQRLAEQPRSRASSQTGPDPAAHPEWEPGAEWPQVVSSYALDDGERLLLFDPIAPPSKIGALIGERSAAWVLTNPWHERGTRALVERLGLPVFVPEPDRGSHDVDWVHGDDGWGEAHVYSPTGLPAGLRAFAGRMPNDFVLWIERHGAVIAGDTVADFGRGLEIPPAWGAQSETREQIADRLRALLRLPVKLLLPTNGQPADRATLARVLA